jgi:hypothetical protein
MSDFAKIVQAKTKTLLRGNTSVLSPGRSPPGQHEVENLPVLDRERKARIDLALRGHRYRNEADPREDERFG